MLQPNYATAECPPQALLSTPRGKPHCRGASHIAEGGATSPRGEPHRQGGSHIAKERKPAANNKKTMGEMSISYKKCSANQRARKMLTHFVYECVF
jgi:hypothetical protein